MPAMVEESKCEGCEACLSACPTGVITMEHAKAKIGSDCVDCGGCVDACPTGAISLA